MQDEYHMTRALKLAQQGRPTMYLNLNVGCAIVKDGEIVGKGYHRCAGEPYVEIHVLCIAGEGARDATAYVTLESCSHYGRTPPCYGTLTAVGVARVAATTRDSNLQVVGRRLHRL